MDSNNNSQARFVEVNTTNNIITTNQWIKNQSMLSSLRVICAAAVAAAAVVVFALSLIFLKEEKADHYFFFYLQSYNIDSKFWTLPGNKRQEMSRGTEQEGVRGGTNRVCDILMLALFFLDYSKLYSVGESIIHTHSTLIRIKKI